MRLFLIAFAISAASTLVSSSCFGQDPQASGSAPLPRARFAESPARAYMIARSRQEADVRNSLLRYYEATGFNYGQPEIGGNVFFSATPPLRSRRLIAYPVYGLTNSGSGN